MKLALVCLEQDADAPPLGLAYIASYLRKYGNFYNTIIVDKEDIMERLCMEKPDVVGISAMTHEFPQAKTIGMQIKKELSIPIILGGHHITLMPNHFENSGFDVGVLGEGEQTMLELVNSFEKTGGFATKSLKKIKGIIYKEGGYIKMTEPRRFIENLDTIPYPARDLLKIKEYYITLKSMTSKFGAYTDMITSRGCPYKCVFCSASAFWKRARFHSAEYVVGEMKEIKEKYRVDGLIIHDDLFTADKKRVEKIVELMKKEGLKDKLSFYVAGRANLTDEHICKLLKEMNVAQVGLGLESGSEKILNYLKKGTVTVEQNRKALKLCKQAGLHTFGYFIIGSPEETEEDLKQTLSFVKDKNLDQFSIFHLTPYPGTDLWEEAKSMGVVSDSPDFDMTKLSMAGFKADVVISKHLTQEDLCKWFYLFQKVVKLKLKKGMLGSLKDIRLRHIKFMFSKNFVQKLRWALSEDNPNRSLKKL